jgi:hypothetical protein
MQIVSMEDLPSFYCLMFLSRKAGFCSSAPISFAVYSTPSTLEYEKCSKKKNKKKKNMKNALLPKIK